MKRRAAILRDLRRCQAAIRLAQRQVRQLLALLGPTISPAEIEAIRSAVYTPMKSKVIAIDRITTPVLNFLRTQRLVPRCGQCIIALGHCLKCGRASNLKDAS